MDSEKQLLVETGKTFECTENETCGIYQGSYNMNNSSPYQKAEKT